MDISKQEKVFRNNPDDVDNKMQVLSNLRKSLKVVDKLNDEKEWPDLEAQLKEEFYRLEKANSELGNERTTQVVHQLKGQLNEVIKVKDVKLGNVVLEEISTLFVHLTLVYQLIGFLRHHDENFNSYQWKDRSRARTLINQGLQKIGEQPDADVLHPIVISVIDLLPTDEQPSGDSSVLVK
jgi:molecular chaperone DnaK